MNETDQTAGGQPLNAAALKRQEEKQQRRDRKKAGKKLRREQQEAYQRAIESGDVETIYRALCQEGLGKNATGFYGDKKPIHLQQALNNAADKKGAVAVADAVMAIVTATLGNMVLSNCAALEYAMIIARGLPPGMQPPKSHEQIPAVLADSVQGFVTMLKNYATARHSLSLKAPQQAEDEADPKTTDAKPAEHIEQKPEATLEPRAA